MIWIIIAALGLVLLFLPIQLKIVFDNKLYIFLYRFKIYEYKRNDRLKVEKLKRIQQRKKISISIICKIGKRILKSLKLKEISIDIGYKLDDYFNMFQLYSGLNIVRYSIINILAYYNIENTITLSNKEINKSKFRCIISTNLFTLSKQILKGE